MNALSCGDEYLWYVEEEHWFYGRPSADGCEGEVIKGQEVPSLIWLAEQARINPAKLSEILERIRRGEELYREIHLAKPDGRKRRIFVPFPELREIQRRINRHVLTGFWPANNVAGFSGGSIIEAIKPHLESSVLLSVDLVNAFEAITIENIIAYFMQGRRVWISGRGIDFERYGLLSWTAANIIAEVCTRGGRLIQGAPTSPRLFDLACFRLDSRLRRLAETTGGVYTRYADNIFFSFKGKEWFPQKVRRAILRIISERSLGYYTWFRWHKLLIRKMGAGATRILGLNVIAGKIHNTRAFKRRLRLSLHHTRWLFDHRFQRGSAEGGNNHLDWGKAWLKLQGQMAFAMRDTLPKPLLQEYLNLEREIAEQ